MVLGAGAYDFFAWHPTIPGIARNIAEEAGTSPEAYLARSALCHAQTIKAPVLLLHGGADERIPVQQSEAFAEQLRSVGVTYRVKIFPAAPHGIPNRRAVARSRPVSRTISPLSAAPIRESPSRLRAASCSRPLGSAGLVAALEGAERFALPPPPAIASVGTQEPMVRRLFPGENRIRTIGPASGKVVDAKFQRSDPGRSNTDFGRRC